MTYTVSGSSFDGCFTPGKNHTKKPSEINFWDDVKLELLPKQLPDVGRPLGLKLGGTLVIDLVGPFASNCGACVGDQLIEIDGMPVASTEEVAEALSSGMTRARVLRTPLSIHLRRPRREAWQAPLGTRSANRQFHE